MEIKRFKGIKNTTTPERLRAGELVVASDVDVDDTGRLMSRQGFTVVNATAAHSLFSHNGVTVLVEGSTLKAVEANHTRTTIKVLTTTAPVSYAAYGDVVYYANGADTGRLAGRTHGQWGVAPPTGQPVASPASGTLPAGRYLYAMTFRRADGHESGTGLVGSIDLTAGGGISFSGLEVSTNPEVYDKLLYVGTPNGDTVYKAAVVPNGQTTALVMELPYGVELGTQHKQHAPAGTMVRHHSGMMLVVQDNVIYFSDPYKPELFWLGENFLRFPGQVALVESVGGGLFIATVDAGSATEAGATWYASGRSLPQMTATQIFDYGAVVGTGASTMAGYFERSVDSGDEPHGGGHAAIWATRHGAIVGFEGGTTRNLTENRYSFPSAQGGSAMVRLNKGFAQYVAVLRGAGTLTNAAS